MTSRRIIDDPETGPPSMDVRWGCLPIVAIAVVIWVGIIAGAVVVVR